MILFDPNCQSLLLSHLDTKAHSPAFSHSAYWTVYESSVVAIQMSYGKYTDYSCYRTWYVNLKNNLQTHKNFSNNRFHSSQCEIMQKMCQLKTTVGHRPRETEHEARPNFVRWYLCGVHDGETDSTLTLLVIMFPSSRSVDMRPHRTGFPHTYKHNLDHWAQFFSETLNSHRHVTHI